MREAAAESTISIIGAHQACPHTGNPTKPARRQMTAPQRQHRWLAADHLEQKSPATLRPLGDTTGEESLEIGGEGVMNGVREVDIVKSRMRKKINKTGIARIYSKKNNKNQGSSDKVRNNFKILFFWDSGAINK